MPDLGGLSEVEDNTKGARTISRVVLDAQPRAPRIIAMACERKTSRLRSESKREGKDLTWL